jgi:uncharacterized protein involved in response to NO
MVAFLLPCRRMVAPWRAEPFRLFFPLGVLLAWVGIGHWLLYAIGATATYSCQLHGLVQVQGFLMAFAFGFLWTAIPRRTDGAGGGDRDGAGGIGAVVTTAAAFSSVGAAEITCGACPPLLLFALRRFAGDARRRHWQRSMPIPLGVLHGCAGAVLILRATAERPRVDDGARPVVGRAGSVSVLRGRRGLILPLIAGTPPRRPRVRAR